MYDTTQMWHDLAGHGRAKMIVGDKSHDLIDQLRNEATDEGVGLKLYYIANAEGDYTAYAYLRRYYTSRQEASEYV